MPGSIPPTHRRARRWKRGWPSRSSWSRSRSWRRSEANGIMHVGTAVVFQNPNRMRPDHEVYRQELRLADLTEPLGYDSVWGVEHHFTDYTMCPDVLQFL